MVKPESPTIAELAARDQQITNLTETIRRMEGERNILKCEASQEALAAQPLLPAIRARLAKAEERIIALEKEKELLRISLEQSKGSDPTKEQQAQKTLSDLREQIAQRDAKLATIGAERDAFQNQLKYALEQTRSDHLRKLIPAPLAAANQELQQKVTSLQQSLSALQTEKTAWEKEKEGLRASVEEGRARASIDPAKEQQAQKAISDLKSQISHQDAKLNTISAERDVLKTALEQARSAPKIETAPLTAANQDLQQKVASLQQSLSALQTEKTAWEKERGAGSTAVSPASLSKSDPRAKGLEAERDDLLKKLNEANRQIAAAKTHKETSSKEGPSLSTLTNQLVLLRSRLEVFEARKVPYTQEELALFKKGEEVALKTAAVAAKGSKKSVKDVPTGTGPLVAEAQRAFSAGRFDEAEQKYQQVLKVDDKNVFTLGNLAATQIQQNHLDAAEESLQKALAVEPSEGDAYSLSLMGIVKFDREKFDEALDYLSRAAQIDPTNAETQNYLGITLSQKGQRAPAEAALRKAVVLQPNYAAAHNNLAVVYATQQPPSLELARFHYQKALSAGHPKNQQLETLLERKESSNTK